MLLRASAALLLRTGPAMTAPGTSTGGNTGVDAASAMALRNRELEALYSISAIFHGALPLEEALEAALAQILEVLGFQAGVVRLLDPATGDLSAVASRGITGEARAVLAASLRIGQAPCGLAIQRREIVHVNDLADGPYADPAWARCGYRTFVSAPLKSRGLVLGCMSLASDRVREFEPRDRELLTALAAQTAMAVANAELHAAARRKIEHFSALHQCSRDLGPAPDPDRVLQLATERMAHLLRLDRTAVLYWDDGADRVAGAAAFGFTPDAVEALRSMPAAHVQEQEPWVSEDLGANGVVPHDFAHSQGSGPALLVPLVARDRTFGLLIGDRSGRPLRMSTDEMELAMIFANQAAVWIAGARALVREQEARAAAESVEVQLRQLLELAPDAILVTDAEGRIALVNGQMEKMFGYAREELLGAPVEILLPERMRRGHVRHRSGYIAAPRTRPMGAGLDLLGVKKDGREFPVEISLSPSHAGDGVISVIRDITDRRAAALERERLLTSEREKGEQLKLAIREAHHRIKNNLQAISDLLYLEVAGGGGESAETVLRESVERIQAIALVHDLLSQEQDVQTVDARAVAERLAPMVLRAHGLSPGAVGLDLHVPAVPLSSKKATTLALVLNELISNAAKHALAGRQDGRLSVRLIEAEEGLRLEVTDNGPGLPDGFEPDRDASVGLQVVRTLVERDLSGKLTLSGGKGLTAAVWFPW
jgi:PAS domain S-box-containing protein